MRFHSARRYLQKFPRLDLTHVLGVDDVERAGLRGHYPCVVEFADHKRPESVGIAHGVNGVSVHHQERVGPLYLAQRLD
jgi:hypothetical protein